MDCFWCSGRAAAALYNCSTFSSFSSNGEVPYRCSLFCALFLGLWFWYILQYLHFLQYTPRIMVYFSVSPFFTQQNSCLWFKTGCTVQLLIWDLKHNISIPPPTLVSSHLPSYLAAFPANPPHSGNVSYQAFFLYITAQPSFGLCSVHVLTYPERSLLFFLQKYPLSHYSCFRSHWYTQLITMGYTWWVKQT